MVKITENLLFIETKGFSMWPFLTEKDKLIVINRISSKDFD
jgi:hypothetical protein